MSLKLAPRVMLHAAGTPPPRLDEGWLVLPRLAHREDDAFVFGDGSHPSTRVCAGAVDLLCRQRMPAAFLDVGTGTGVLARIARARGVSFVVGIDIDANALASAEAHARLDVHPTPIHFGAEAPDAWGARFDLVVANILAEVLQALAAPLARSLATGGTLLLSGFTPRQSPVLRRAFEAQGLAFAGESRLEEWALLRWERDRADGVQTG